MGQHLTQSTLSDAAWAYFSGGAADEISLRRNLSAWQAWGLSTRVLRDLRGGHTRCRLRGREWAFPLVDVMLVLLIVFIITIPVVQHAVKVELPRASSTKDKTPPENLQLAVDAQGQFFLGKQPVAVDALEGALREHAAKDPQPQLYIRGDKKVPYEQVALAMTAAQRAGLTRIGFVTESARP